MSNTEFFAAVDTDRITYELSDRIDDWTTVMRSSVNYERMMKSYRKYYGLSKMGTANSSKVRAEGEKDELAMLNFNHYRNLIQHLLVMTTSQRPAFECRAANTDEESMAHTILGNGILDYYMREKKLERFLRDATELALIYSEGYIGMRWDPLAGSPVDVDPMTGDPVYEGDVVYSTYSPMDMIKDLSRKNADQDWYMPVEYENKWELIAQYPEMKDQILSMDYKRQDDIRNEYIRRVIQDSDLVPVYHFYYRRCKALPQGRYVKFLGRDAKLLDTPLPYKNVPVHRISPSNQLETPFGFSVGFDLLGPQDVYDTLASISFTNQKTFGVQNILVPEGHNLNPTQIFGGLNMLTYNQSAGEIKALQLTNTPREVFENMDRTERVMQSLSAVNSVSRGQPDGNIKSGSFAALVAGQAIQFNSGLQNSYNMQLEDVGMGTIEMLQTFAKTKRVANIVGKHNRFMLKEFSGDDLNRISRVVVDAANPMTKTLEGRMEVANQLLQSGLIKDPEQYIQVYSTGKLEPLLENQQSELMLIRDENESLQDGAAVQVVSIDDHLKHIHEHKSVIDNMDARSNPKVLNAVLTHIQQHIDALKNTDPTLLEVLGQTPIAPPPPPGMPMQNAPQGSPVPPPGGAPQGPGGPPPQGKPMPHPNAVQAPKHLPAQLHSPASNMPAKQPGMPSMPKNAMTGQPFNQQTGGQ